MRFGPAPARHMPLSLCAAFLTILFGASARADLWVTAYYPGYEQNYLNPTNIDFTALTHIVHFSVVPNSDGSLDSGANGLNPASCSNLVSLAHAAAKKAILCVGGANSESDFLAATTSTTLSNFVHSLTNFAATYGYDGIDVDWESLPMSDFGQYTNFIISLRAALDRFPGHKLLTAAAFAYPSYGDPPASEAQMYSAMQGYFDQINVMTYNLSGPYEGWVTWFNANLYDGGYRFPSTGGLVPSAYGSITNFLENGVAADKLAISMAFYGEVWAGGSGTSTGGVTQPRQSWTNAPTVTTVAYYDIISSYYQSNIYFWDSAAQAPYLSIVSGNAAACQFISYDDEHLCQAKVSFARNLHLGGVMIWELGQGYQATLPAGQREALLESIKQAMATPGAATIRQSGENIQIGFGSAPLGLYRVLWASNFVAPVWNTLTNNVPGTNGPVQVTDPGAVSSQSQRLYRVQTPP